MDLLQYSPFSWNIFFFGRGIWVLLELVRRRKQNFTIIDQERHKIEQINIWSPLTTGFIMQTLIYVISMVFLSVMRGLPLWRNVPSEEERRGTAIFAGYRHERFVLISLRYADRLKNKTKQMLILLLALSTLSLLIFSLSCAGILPSTKPLLFSSIISGGLFFNSAIPLFIELTMECAYPVGEGLASSLNMTMTNIIGLFFYIPFMLPHSDVRWMNWMTVCSLGASVLGLLIYREKYTRLEIDERDDVDERALRNSCEKHLAETGFD